MKKLKLFFKNTFILISLDTLVRSLHVSLHFLLLTNEPLKGGLEWFGVTALTVFILYGWLYFPIVALFTLLVNVLPKKQYIFVITGILYSSLIALSAHFMYHLTDSVNTRLCITCVTKLCISCFYYPITGALLGRLTFNDV